MKLAKAFSLSLAAIFVSYGVSADVLDFTDADLKKAKGACLAGSGFDFITEADGSLSIKNLEGKGKLHVGNKSIDVVDVPDSDKKKEFDDIRSCIRGYLIQERTRTEYRLRTEYKVCMGNGGGPSCASGADAVFNCDTYSKMGGGAPVTYDILAHKFCDYSDNGTIKLAPHKVDVTYNVGGGQCGWTAFRVICNP